jgi:hypothetical protein
MQHDVIKFVSDMQQLGIPVSSTNKTDHDKTEILLKVVLTITLTHILDT